MGFFDSALDVVSKIGGATSGLGPLLELGGGIWGAGQSQSSANQQMAFQAKLSNTSHQREVKDLIAAGLNPILSAKYGGASTPPGASAQIGNPASNYTSSAVAAKKAREEVALLNSQKLKTDEETHNAKAMHDVLMSQVKLNDNNSAKSFAEEMEAYARIGKVGEEMKGIQYDNWKRYQLAKLFSTSEGFQLLRNQERASAARNIPGMLGVVADAIESIPVPEMKSGRKHNPKPGRRGSRK